MVCRILSIPLTSSFLLDHKRRVGIKKGAIGRLPSYLLLLSSRRMRLWIIIFSWFFFPPQIWFSQAIIQTCSLFCWCISLRPRRFCFRVTLVAERQTDGQSPESLPIFSSQHSAGLARVSNANKKHLWYRTKFSPKLRFRTNLKIDLQPIKKYSWV